MDIYGRTAAMLAAASMVTTPAVAQDETKTGILAGLGVAAATGKTSLGGGAGAIEAGLLSADAFNQSAHIVARVVAQVVPPVRYDADGKTPVKEPWKGKVVVLGGSDSVDLLSPAIIQQRIDVARRLLREARTRKCLSPEEAKVKAKEPKEGALPKVMGFFDSVKSPVIADAAGVIITEASIAGIELKATDSRMLNALMMTKNISDVPAVLDGNWQPARGEYNARALPVTVAGETAGRAAPSKVGSAYDSLIADLAAPDCDHPDDQRRAVTAAAATLAQNLTEAKEGPSVLARAIQAEAYVGDDPIIVRTVIEQIGGTSIARSGVGYTFGWPNAATVNAGLLISFRVIDPKAARLIAVGEVRCLTPQTNVKKVRDLLRHEPSDASTTRSERQRRGRETVCDYRAVGA